MKKNFVLFSMILMLLFVSIPSMAAQEPIVYKDTIEVTEDGGRYKVGFVNVEFKKGFMEKLPRTFEVEVYAENGLVYVEFSPDAQDFVKKVHIKVDNYSGLLYDVESQKNIEVNVKKQQVLVKHFSRYCLD